jgi:OFA family oxalate/formate antiporter-like MFS transporter
MSDAAASGRMLPMLVALGLLYVMIMGSSFASLGVVLPHMIPSLGLSWTQAGSGFTVLALAAGLCSVLPGLLIRRLGARLAIGSGVTALVLAYAVLATCHDASGYFAGALLLGVGFALAGAVPALHLLGAAPAPQRPLMFGAYLGCGGVGGATWPGIVEGTIRLFGGWRDYWWFMAALMAVAGSIAIRLIAEPDDEQPAGDASPDSSLRAALRTPQFYAVGCAISATYLVSSTLNAFTMSYLRLHGVGLGIAVLTFSIQSAGHAAFPLLMGGIAGRVGVRALLTLGLLSQALGLVALAGSVSMPALVLFAIGVGGGYGTVMIGTTLAIDAYYGGTNFARIMGANQLFSIVSVVGPALAGWVADATGRFDTSFYGCAVVLLAIAAWSIRLRAPHRAPASVVLATSQA